MDNFEGAVDGVKDEDSFDCLTLIDFSEDSKILRFDLNEAKEATDDDIERVKGRD